MRAAPLLHNFTETSTTNLKGAFQLVSEWTGYTIRLVSNKIAQAIPTYALIAGINVVFFTVIHSSVNFLERKFAGTIPSLKKRSLVYLSLREFFTAGTVVVFNTLLARGLQIPLSKSTTAAIFSTVIAIRLLINHAYENGIVHELERKIEQLKKQNKRDKKAEKIIEALRIKIQEGIAAKQKADRRILELEKTALRDLKRFEQEKRGWELEFANLKRGKKEIEKATQEKQTVDKKEIERLLAVSKTLLDKVKGMEAKLNEAEQFKDQKRSIVDSRQPMGAKSPLSKSGHKQIESPKTKSPNTPKKEKKDTPKKETPVKVVSPKATPSRSRQRAMSLDSPKRLQEVKLGLPPPKLPLHRALFRGTPATAKRPLLQSIPEYSSPYKPGKTKDE